MYRLVPYFCWTTYRQIYAHCPCKRIVGLKLRIRKEFAGVPGHIRSQVMGNTPSKLEGYLRKDGGHLQYVVFKKEIKFVEYFKITFL